MTCNLGGKIARIPVFLFFFSAQHAWKRLKNWRSWCFLLTTCSFPDILAYKSRSHLLLINLRNSSLVLSHMLGRGKIVYSWTSQNSWFHWQKRLRRHAELLLNTLHPQPTSLKRHWPISPSSEETISPQTRTASHQGTNQARSVQFN